VHHFPQIPVLRVGHDLLVLSERRVGLADQVGLLLRNVRVV
jgi:hypothetical protein